MDMYKDTLTGKVALVTGAGSGIGRAAAKLLAHAGARIAALSRTEEELREVCDEIRALGSEALMLVADVSRADQMERAYATIQKTWQQLDIVVANAGINGLWAPLEEISLDAWDTTMNVNLKGTFLTVKYSLPLLKTRGGSIVVISSVNGTRVFSNTGASVYATTKAGQLAFARMIALEVARHRIRINTVCPGSIDTRIEDSMVTKHIEQIREPVEFPEGQIPLTRGKPGSAEQVASLIWFLCSNAASHITGSEVFVDGAESLLQG